MKEVGFKEDPLIKLSAEQAVIRMALSDGEDGHEVRVVVFCGENDDNSPCGWWGGAAVLETTLMRSSQFSSEISLFDRDPQKQFWAWVGSRNNHSSDTSLGAYQPVRVCTLPRTEIGAGNPKVLQILAQIVNELHHLHKNAKDKTKSRLIELMITRVDGFVRSQNRLGRHFGVKVLDDPKLWYYS